MCVLLSKVITQYLYRYLFNKKSFTHFQSEDLSRAVHVTKLEANKHGD